MNAEFLAADSANKSIAQHCLIITKIRLRTEAPKAQMLTGYLRLSMLHKCNYNNMQSNVCSRVAAQMPAAVKIALRRAKFFLFKTMLALFMKYY